ncbi:MAG TPA: glycosyltransferase family 39 protein [Kofleriaceae bacterium]|nr:glycosyltransferase family 39 protein [Kofleriaceae bacterium]
MTFERRLLFAALGAWLVVTVLGVVSGPPLGHDEAAFSVIARGGGSAWLYRSSGVVALAKIGVALGGRAWVMRLPTGLAGFGVPLGAWAVGRRAFGARTGAWAAAVLAGAHPMMMRSAELIGDLPATACMLAGIAVVVGELEPSSGDDAMPTWRFLLAAPAFAGAFYLRYGSAPVIAIVTAAALVLWWRPIARRPAPVIATAVAFVALLAPHAVHSLHATGRLFGILEESSRMPRREYVGEGLVTYLAWIPQFWFGALVTPLMIAGGIAFAKPPVRARATWFLGAIAVGQIIAIGLQSHAQPRYIFVATSLLVVLGVSWLQRALMPRPRAALALVATSWLACAIAVIPFNVHLARLRAPLMAAAEAIHTDAAGRPCIVVAHVITQLAWYTGCETELVRDPDKLDLIPAGMRGYIASVPHGLVEAPIIATTLRATPGPIATGNDLSHVWLLR